MQHFVGIDFGTTNSAIAIATPEGQVQVAHYSFLGQSIETFRSVLYFSSLQRDSFGQPFVFAGPQALEKYLAEDGEGRLLLSPKNSLASQLFDVTRVHRQTYKLEDLVAMILKDLRKVAEEQFGDLGKRVVAGRPVEFMNMHSPEHEELALRRLRDAFHLAGFEEVIFEYEPVAAAYTYEQGLEQDELVLIADFGGGTTDFCLMNVGRGVQHKPPEERILGTEGVAIAGDIFDGRVVQKLVSPALGYGSTIKSEFGKLLPMPVWPYTNLSQWYTIGMLREPRTLNMLYELRAQSQSPEKLEAFLNFVEDNLGFHLYRAVEGTKVALSSQEETVFRFQELEKELQSPLHRTEFEEWISPDIQAIEDCCDRLLERTGVTPEQVDQVFMTGGTSFVPAVRQLFLDRFGESKIGRQQEFTSVAYGLALRAADVFSR